MNLRQVFVSVLMFGVAGLLLFMYLQAWIEEQHTGTVDLDSFMDETKPGYVPQPTVDAQ
ncbi:PREDICTED: carbohydrate sulfotransferase 9-like [Cariama cristata]|uniref:carbohydrate sulfotransferase 9-like n=1 Tax=Cariama cristata TaxID=54380 RepID=UPI00051FF8D9|nr:PREDICTED: carbohydrate sulfotransferase 9-like [Cariama cristata]